MCPSGIHLYNLNQSCSSSLFKMHQLLLIEVTAMSPFTRDGKSVKNSTDEYFSLKNSTKTRISRHFAICAKTALYTLNYTK